MSSSVKASLDWLFQQFPSYQKIGSKAYKPTLDNTRQILSLLGNPEDSLRFIHVAGSNGKGSTCSYLASILKEHGLKVGLFTSPHIVHFSERIRVNGKPIGDPEIEDFVERIRATELSFSPSFFEITFGMALEHFKNEACDICVIETGLGGRLDATNVIHPELSIITSISLEHTQLLGNTLEEIAVEKAGIIKENTPVVFGKGCTPVLSTLKECADAVHAPTILSEELPSEYADYFQARYQRENVATVLTALKISFPEVSASSIKTGLEHLSANTGFYGRLQVMQQSPKIIFDVSHNADGIAATFEAILSNLTGELFVIYGTSNDKDLNSIKKIIPPEIHFFGTEFSNERSATREQLEASFNEIDFKSSHYFNEPSKALDAAKDKASDEDTILVIGSFFLLSDFF